MTKEKSFTIIHNLDGLSEEQIQYYLHDASIYFGLDPDLNGLDVIWMNAEDGLRKKVVYARKGTTDILRDLRGITVLSLVQHDGPGYVSFMATGRNAKDRQEIAVGAHETEGLKGKRLADAVATAQTRALRRLTLQFVGGGLLDISEVNAQTTDIGASTASLAQLAGSPVVMPPPQAAPATAPGRNITPQTDTKADMTLPPEELKPVESTTSSEMKPDTKAVSEPPTEAEIIAQPIEPKKRGRRRKRNTVDIASPGQEPQEVRQGVINPLPLEEFVLAPAIPQAAIDLVNKIVIDAVNSTMPMPIQAVPAAPAQANPAPLTIADIRAVRDQLAAAPSMFPAVGVVRPDVVAEKMKEYRARLSKYSMEILPKAGMMPTEGIGGVTMKLRKFALVQVGATDVTKLTPEQWEELFGFLDSYTKQYGEAELVKYIDKAIGVA